MLQANGPTDNDGQLTSDARPEVVITTEEHLVNDEALAALATRDAEIYQRGGLLVHTIREGGKFRGIERPDHAPRLAALPQAVLRERLAAACRFVTVRDTPDGPQSISAHPPDWCVKALRERGNYHGMRSLEGIVEFPVLRADGSIFDVPGYDPMTGLIYEPTGPIPQIPATPNRAEAMAARDLLLDVVLNFPFEKPAHCSTWLAALITALARRAFIGPSPLFLFDANTAGSGKTLLAEIISLIVNGRDIPRMANPRNDIECKKLLLALAICGDPLVLIDNISGTLGCPSLDAALTGTSSRDRILGRSQMVELPLAQTWMASGNNVILRGDTNRRVAHCRLDSKVENPEERDGFKYPDLKSHIKEHRGELLAAALTILRAYILAGQSQAKLKPWGSYERWSDLIRQAVVWIELPDPGDTREQLKSADTEVRVLRAFLDGLAAADPADQGMTTAEILKAIEPIRHPDGPPQIPVGCEALSDAVHELCDTTPKNPPGTRTLGNRLAKVRRRIIGGRTLDGKEDGHGFVVWKVCTSDSTESSDSLFKSVAHAHPSAQRAARSFRVG